MIWLPMATAKIDYVLDANVIMSIVISGKAYHQLLLSNLNCLTIDFVFNEIATHKAIIQQKGQKKSYVNILLLFSAPYRLFQLWQLATKIGFTP